MTRRHQFRTLLAVLSLLALGIGMGCTPPPSIQRPENAVARVGTTFILRPEFKRAVELRVAELKRRNPARVLTDREIRTLGENALEMLVQRELLFQAAKFRDVRLMPNAIPDRLAEVKADFGSEEAFRTFLRETNRTEVDFIVDVLEKDLLIEAYVEEYIRAPIVVTGEEIDARYQERKHLPERVRARHIVKLVRSDALPPQRERIFQQVQGLRERIIAGEDFASLARQHSDGPSAAQGGDVGYFSADEMVRPFAEAAFALEPGEVSQVVTTEYGYHVIQTLARQEPREAPLEELYQTLYDELFTEKFEAAMDAELDRLRDEITTEVYEFTEGTPGQAAPALPPQPMNPVEEE